MWCSAAKKSDTGLDTVRGINRSAVSTPSVQPALGSHRRHFQADIATAHDGDACALPERGLKPVHIGDVTEIVNPGRSAPGQVSLRTRVPVAMSSLS